MSAEDQLDDEQNLETLLAKATNPLHRHPDPQSLSAFCEMVEKQRDGPQTALCLLAHKIQSPLEKESLLALAVLEESVKRSGTKFRSEVGKFRFLNEMIKVVSPKYLGNRASPNVKQKIVELMFLWSVELKQEVKIFEAYQMLKRQGVVMDDPVYVIKDYQPPEVPAPRPRNEIFDDEERAQQLQTLLRSKKPEDLQAANRLIKSMVREADHRMEIVAKRSTELETVHNNAKVLADMLDHYNPKETSSEEKELMKELFESCERLRPKLFRLAGEMGEKDEGLNDILKANDELTIVISRYKKVMGISTGNAAMDSHPSDSDKNGTSLLDLGSPVQQATPPVSDNSLLDDQLLALGLKDPTDTVESSKALADNFSAKSSHSTDLDQLLQINDNLTSTSPRVPFQKTFTLTTSTSSSLSSSLPLNTIATSAIGSVFDGRLPFNAASDVACLKAQTTSSSATMQSKTQTVSSSSKGLADLDELSQSMLKKSLPALSSVKLEFPSTPQKIPLSQLKQQQENSAKNMENIVQTNVMIERSPTPQSPSHDVLSLSDIFVPLETVQPGSLSPLILLEKNDITVVIHFGKNVPRSDVCVMVVSTMSKNSSPVKNVIFQAAVPKSMKIKLQPPSATDLPPHNPILPAAAITQVLLLANPQKEKVRFKYKLNYNLNNEDFTEVGEIDSLFSAR